MNNHASNNNKRAAVKPPRNIEVVHQHDASISIMTSEVNANHVSNNNTDNGYSCKNYLIKNLKLENCATKNCSNKLHHLCQNNIDNVLYNIDFEEHFGCICCCFECIEEQMKYIPPYCHNLFDSETSESEEEAQYNTVVENETDIIINDDNIIELDDNDSEYSDDEDTSDSEVDNEEDESVEDKINVTMM